MPTVTPDKFGAVLFDLDGVITATARIHASAWKQAFDEFLKKCSADGSFEPFDKQADYEDYVDGKLSYEVTVLNAEAPVAVSSEMNNDEGRRQGQGRFRCLTEGAGKRGSSLKAAAPA